MAKAQSMLLPKTEDVAELHLSQEKQLDLLLIYLRRVHAFCLYCGEEYEDERMLGTRCGPQHIRNHQKISDEEFQSIFEQSSKEFSREEEVKVDDVPQEIEAGDDYKVGLTLNRINSLGEKEKIKESKLAYFKKISKLNPIYSDKFGGSITFLTKYVKLALDKISEGPRNLINPQEVFYEKDLNLYCRS